MKHLSKYFKSRKKALTFLLRYSKRKFSKKAFHRFRVEVKRLNALLQILHRANPKFDFKSVQKAIRKLFKKAGPIREMQLEKDLLSEHKLLDKVPDLKSKLDKEIQKRRNEFFKSRNLARTKKIKKRFRRIQKEIKNQKPLEFTHFIEDLWEEILLMIASGIDPVNAHLLRKKLKIYQYSLEILGKNNFPIHIPKIEELSSLLGAWHDRDVFLIRVEAEDLIAKVSPDERKIFTGFVESIRQESAEMFQAIQTKLAQIQ
ncbi:CHAD domain-containing protein [Algoriphagus mannitolivorans]|uniref:CHAD domain-containing protein n=1 Tax=Algoriphagus mannitolivorans TaxID=226504 RepID=UPI00042988C1|nr:CHAD domain-containing protein [Algoriphagus mannitolivorans]